MEGISAFIVAFCTVCTVIGGLSLLVPSGTFARPLKYVSCLVFLCVLLGSVFGVGKIDFEIERHERENTQSSTAQLLAEQTFAEALRLSNIQFEKIEVFTDKSKSGSIFITEVVVYSAAPYGEIADVLSSDGAYEVRVVNE